jgi:DNA-binding transcriptional ArsR family regulator
MVKYMLNRSDPADRVFHALSDGTRRAIVERLVRGPAAVSDLAQPFAMSLSAVLQHLQVLVDSGLVVSQKSGRVRTCRIDPGALRAAEEWITRQRTSWERSFDRLGDVLDKSGDSND